MKRSPKWRPLLYHKAMRTYKYKLLQAACLILAVVIIYNTYSNGGTEAMNGRDVNVLFYVGSLLVAVALVGLSIYFSTKTKKKH